MLSALTGQYEAGSAFRGASFSTGMSLGLFQKKCFRAYREFTTNTVIKAVFAKPFLLTAQGIWTGAGTARMGVIVGGTEGGTFTALGTKFCLNTIAGDIPGNTTMTVGGTITGGTEREVLRSDSGGGLGGAAGNGNQLRNNRILAAGTYYFSIVVGGTGPTGFFSLEWEELDDVPVVT